jgi:hypothetical protein
MNKPATEANEPERHDGALVVRQAAFAIAKRGTSVEALETRAINFCTGIAAVHPEKGIAVLGHFDPIAAVDVDRMVEALKEHTGGDLTGFQIHAVHGVKNWHLPVLAGLLLLLLQMFSGWMPAAAIWAFAALGFCWLAFTRVWLHIRFRSLWPEAAGRRHAAMRLGASPLMRPSARARLVAWQFASEGLS